MHETCQRNQTPALFSMRRFLIIKCGVNLGQDCLAAKTNKNSVNKPYSDNLFRGTPGNF